MKFEISNKQKAFIEKTLNKFNKNPLINWDRFFYDDYNKMISVYGWIERKKDYYKDFVQIDFKFKLLLTKFRKIKIILDTTSSAQYSPVISKKLFGDNHRHSDCIRVEDYFFKLKNSIKLKPKKK